MSSTIDRRSFLTHSAATVGGIAMAGSVVDGMLAGVAGAATGVAKGKPKLGGILTVGTAVRRAELPHIQRFIGQIGRLGLLCRQRPLRPALRDVRTMARRGCPCWRSRPSRARTSRSGRSRCVTACSFTTARTLTPRSSWRTTTPLPPTRRSGLAIQPIIASVKEINSYTVEYTMVVPFAAFPITLSEQQIAYMAAPSALGQHLHRSTRLAPVPSSSSPGASGWSPSSRRIEKYWRKDGAGRRLPYLDGINFKTIVDSALTQRGPAVGIGRHDPPGERASRSSS